MSKRNEVAGVIINCPNYNPCPLCYGCRNFNPRYMKCIKNCGEYKEDVCNTKKHRSDLIAKMIIPETVILDKEMIKK